MTGPGPTYLYGWGQRKHIQAGEDWPRDMALCGMRGGRPEPRFFEDQHRWYGRKVAERRITRFEAMPVCKHCIRGAS
jgi:hypothetical protein